MTVFVIKHSEGKHFFKLTLNREKTLTGWEKLVTFLHHKTLRGLTNLSLTAPNFIRDYTQKWGNWSNQVCGCIRQGLKVMPCLSNVMRA